MKKIVMPIFLGLAFAGAALAKEPRVEKATNVLNEIMSSPDHGIPHDLMDKAVCVGIVPSEIKVALGVGADFGHGVMVCRRHGDSPWGAPSEFTMGGGSFGFQIGGEGTDVVFLVMNEDGARKFVSDHVKLGGDASIAAGPVGRTGQAATDAELHAEILSYSRTRGLFAGVSLAGAVVKQDHGANRRLYGRDISSKEILFGGIPIPPEARPLHAALEHYSPRGGTRYSASLVQ